MRREGTGRKEESLRELWAGGHPGGRVSAWTWGCLHGWRQGRAKRATRDRQGFRVWGSSLGSRVGSQVKGGAPHVRLKGWLCSPPRAICISGQAAPPPPTPHPPLTSDPGQRHSPPPVPPWGNPTWRARVSASVMFRPVLFCAKKALLKLYWQVPTGEKGSQGQGQLVHGPKRVASRLPHASARDCWSIGHTAPASKPPPSACHGSLRAWALPGGGRAVGSRQRDGIDVGEAAAKGGMDLAAAKHGEDPGD